jgi:hypothetical protein
MIRGVGRAWALVSGAVLALGVLAGPASAATPQLTFSGPTDYGAASGTKSVAVGDFNGDGVKDLAIANASTVSIRLGNGDGTFQGATSYPVGSSGSGHPLDSTSIAVGDFNQDGNKDLAVANYGDDNVSILLGNGDGTFRPQTTYSVGSNPDSLAVGDFNNDGHQDLAVANYSDNTVSVLLGKGDGTFQAQSISAVGAEPSSVVVGDFNGDGRSDLAVADYGDSTVSILLNKADGSGTFAGSGYSTGPTPTGLAVGDFNGDGHPDLAVANDSSDPDHNFRNTVSILLGTSNGTFQDQAEYTTSESSWSIVVGDFNGDGQEDLALTLPRNDEVAVLSGDGEGAFGSEQDWDLGSNHFPEGLAVGDFNGDGSPDLVSANTFAGNASVLVNAPTADPGPGSLSFGSASSPVALDTVSPAQTVTITNNGSAPLIVSGFAFSGNNPDDFLTGGDTCHASVAPGASCAVSVRFAPQAQGSRSAQLSVLSNAPSSPPLVTLTGTAGPIPQGPRGNPGARGSRGATGATGSRGALGRRGPRGPAGRNGTVHVKVQCVYRESGEHSTCHASVKMVHAGRAARARLSRRGKLYASGRLHGRLLRLHDRRAVRPGRYTLTLSWRTRSGRLMTTRATVRIG